MNKTILTCDMVNDMLPLYVDGILSEESKTAVEEHLKNCTKCQQTLKDLQAELSGMENILDTDDGLFKGIQKKFKMMYLLRTVIAILILCILWVAANFYLVLHYSPVNPKAQADYIEDCLEVVMIDDCFYLHQEDMFAQGEIVLLQCENGEINFYLGENGIRNLGLGRSYMIVPKYQLLIEPEVMSEITTVNYCKPDGTVITTLWQSEDAITTLTTR